MKLFVSSTITVLFCIWIGSTALAAYLYSGILKNQQAPVLAGVRFGDYQYTIQTETGCAGTLEVAVAKSDDDNISIESSGRVAAGLFTKKMLLTINIKIYFNSLGQLTASVLQFDEGTSRVSFGTAGINPLMVTARLDSPAGPVLRTVPLPGPVTVREKGDELLFYYPFMGSLELPGIRKLEEGLPELNVQRATADQLSACQRNETAAIDLMPLISVIPNRGIGAILGGAFSK